MTVDLEKEIVELRSTIQSKVAEETRLRAAADQVVADLKAKGINPLVDKDAYEQVDSAYKPADALRDEVSELRSRLDATMRRVGEKADEEERKGSRTREARSIAEALLRSAELKALRDSKVLEMSQARVEMAPVEVATRDAARELLRLRATVTNAAGSGGGVIWSDRLENLIVPMPERRVRLLDVITIGETDSDTVEFVRETTRTHAAAPTPYGTAAPEASYGYTKDSTSVKRIPHHVPATKGALMDSGQLKTLLETSLVKGLRLEAERQALVGDGTGENLRGILQTVGIGAQALGSDTRFDAVHKAITNVRINYEDEPSVIGMHPTDFESVVLEKDANGNYVHGRSAEDIRTIWGLTPVVSTLFTPGNPLVGDYSQYVMWMRTGISVAASDSHADFFLKGLVALLAEFRAAATLLQPKAFCQLTGF